MRKLSMLGVATAAAVCVIAISSIPTALVSPAKAAELSGSAVDGDRTAVNYSKYRHRVRYASRHDFPYVRGVTGDGDPYAPGSGYCSFGSYVACFYSGTFCWQRCY